MFEEIQDFQQLTRAEKKIDFLFSSSRKSIFRLPENRFSHAYFLELVTLASSIIAL